MGSVKEAIRWVASRAAVHMGVTAAGRALFPKRGALILYGHRVAGDDEGFLPGLSPRHLDQQLSYLTRHYQPITLGELLSCYETGRPVPPRSFVLTFDDGFRDNLTTALPILARHGVPATVFVVTGCVTSGQLPWPQRLGMLFQRTAAKEAVVDADGDRARRFSLETSADRRRAYVAVKEGLKPLPRALREEALAELGEQLAVQPPGDRMLSWADLEELRAAGWEVGAHTYSHAWLARIPLSEAEEELVRCRQDLADRLGVERPPFCFPAGSWSPGLLGMVQRLGFRSAFRPSPPHRVNTLANSHPFCLARVGLPDAPAVQLEAELDGPLPLVRRLWRGQGRAAACAG